ncbi:DUF3267 domain-containing protein [Ornithinibacillus sp. L9]|uniref:DUF3267 domain-containing protein n=1 Tax=Ornithinibacillus caprae TaxID=2678566 RepID=A0A6N8FMU6_9BACI|nr:DUF3267 domain-containing protein [Ornithinibacillus caprae]MUK90076.1 DUF3267 domain-containing protein [Ornithinibacillus caprae]
MNCLKSINLHKEYGKQWIRFISCLTGLLAFVFMYVPATIIHGGNQVNESGVFYLIIALIFLLPLHSFVHKLPLLMVKKKNSTKNIKKKSKRITNRYPHIQLSKMHFLLVALAPTIIVTIPGILASFLIPEFYVFILIFTSIHIGITFIDFIYIFHIARAPKEAFVENGNEGFHILLKASN